MPRMRWCPCGRFFAELIGLGPEPGELQHLAAASDLIGREHVGG